MAEPKPRVLRELVSGVYLLSNDVSVTGVEINPAMFSDNWIILGAGGAASDTIGVWRSYFDTSGFTREDLTFFPTNPQVQDFGAATSNVLNVFIYDIMSVKPITDEDIETMFTAAQFDIATPGSLHSNHDLQDIIYARWRVYTINQAEAYNVVSQQGTYGLNTPTGRNRIFITRVVSGSWSDGQYLHVPGCAFVLGGVTAEEKDLVHLERIRRNYDHSAQG